MQLVERKTRADDQSDLVYYVYPDDHTDFRRVLVYIHGLISDINWFHTPENLPPDTGIVFLPRQPRTNVDRFETWTRNYELCLVHYKANHDSQYYHLVAQCFGVQCAAHWAAIRPETFDTLTFACPPIELRNEFSLVKKLSILFGRAKGLQHCELTPRSYGRSPTLMDFIEKNPTTVYHFTNSFYRQTNRLRKWLHKNAFSVPTPTPIHVIMTSEDAVAKPRLPVSLPNLPDRTSLILSDHYCELLPSRNEFWHAVFQFQMDHERRYDTAGEIESVLVTGATGFLGSHIARRLHAEGKRVVIFARNTAKAEKMISGLGDRIEIRKGSMDNLSALNQALGSVDAVVHTAGHVSDWDTLASFEKTNIDGTKNIMTLAHETGVKQFIHISSLGVFGDVDQDHVDENNPLRFSSDYYSNTKILSEVAVRKYGAINRMPVSVIRPGFIYGEDDNNFLPNLIDTVKKGKAKYIGSRENYLNTVYVGNVVELVAAVLGNPRCFGESYNIADPQDTKIGDFMDDVCAGLGLTAPSKIAPKNVALAAATLLENLFRGLHLKKAPPLTRKKVTFMARSRSVNASKAYALIGREPYSYQDGMRRTLASFKP